MEDNIIIISIKDHGCGINRENFDAILTGTSFKVNGNGIGLSTANKFMNSIDGKLTINSIINNGTTITLQFNNLIFADQFTTKINIKTKRIIVVDDDPNIINFWQECFLFNLKNKNTRYFLNFSSFKNYLTKEQQNNETTYLLDYNILGEKLTGFDIVKEHNLQNVFLITNYAEDIKLQNEIKGVPIKLVPKTMLSILLKNNIVS